jgi:TetR/AcrR family transcriptional regulator
MKGNPVKGAGAHRMRAAERRRHLIAVAVRLFAARGFSGTTTKAIAQGSGVSEAIIFRHFKSKEDLYGAILREKARQDGYQQLIARLQTFAAHGEDQQLVSHLVLHMLESFESDPDFHRLMLHAALERPDLVKVGRRILGMPIFKLLCSYIVRRQKAGSFRKGPPELLAFGIMALPMHFGMVTQVIGIKRMNRPIRELADTFTEIILDGMQVPRGARHASNHHANENGIAAMRARSEPKKLVTLAINGSKETSAKQSAAIRAAGKRPAGKQMGDVASIEGVSGAR